MAVLALHAQTPSSDFEVASIRMHNGPLSRIADYSISGRRVTLSGYNAPLLVSEAYNLKQDRISFSFSSAMIDDYYDITALAPDTASPTREEFRRMLESLLMNRFKLKVHSEQRKLSVYALVVAKSGLSLPESSADGRCATRVGPAHPDDRNYRYQFTGCSLEALVNTLQMDRPVIDKTGSTKRYDFTLFATPSFKMRDLSEPGDISIEDSVQQLGLKLESRKEPMTVLVVDRIEKPTDN
jgi:uncharacterized protein (TIGR03435 family)